MYAIQMFICLIEALCINSLVSVGVPVSVFILPLELQSYYYARRYEFDGYWIGINVFTIILSLLLLLMLAVVVVVDLGAVLLMVIELSVFNDTFYCIFIPYCY